MRVGGRGRGAEETLDSDFYPSYSARQPSPMVAPFFSLAPCTTFATRTPVTDGASVRLVNAVR